MSSISSVMATMFACETPHGFDPERRMVDEYARIRGPYWSPVFRRQRIASLLERKPWWWGFARLCSVTSEAMTIEHDNFRHDCKAAMTEVEMKQDVSDAEQTLEHLIYRRVQAYVLGKTERKYYLSWQKVQGNPASGEKELRETNGRRWGSRGIFGDSLANRRRLRRLLHLDVVLGCRNTPPKRNTSRLPGR